VPRAAEGGGGLRDGESGQPPAETHCHFASGLDVDPGRRRRWMSELSWCRGVASGAASWFYRVAWSGGARTGGRGMGGSG
jgi:hypothetical protein